MRKIQQSFILIGVTACLLSTAQEVSKNGVKTEIIQKDVEEQNKMSNANLIEDATDGIEKWGEEVLTQFKLSDWGLTEDGKYFLLASQTTSLKNTDPQFGDSLVNAFDKAMMKAQEKYLMDRFGRIATEKVKSYFANRSTNAKEIPLPAPNDPNLTEKLKNVISKKLDLTEKKIDQELIKMGENPETLRRLTPVQKKTLFSNSFLKNSIQKASGSIRGLFPIQTAIITDKKGRTSVGVVVVASNKTIQIAKDITLQRESVINGNGGDIKRLLPKTSDKFIATLGTRLVYDKHGKPAILSYGIASYRPDSGDDYINDELRSQAKEQAKMNANAQIAETIAGRMTAKNISTTGEEVKKTVERELTGDASTIEKTVKNIVKIMNNNAHSYARTKLQGITTIKNWNHTAKSGQRYIGIVRLWTYNSLKAIKSFNSRKSFKRKGQKGGFNSQKKTSDPVNNIYDF